MSHLFPLGRKGTFKDQSIHASLRECGMLEKAREVAVGDSQDTGTWEEGLGGLVGGEEGGRHCPH